MIDDNDFQDSRDEEILGAPALSSSVEQRERRLTEQVTLNRYVHQQADLLELKLLEAAHLIALLEVLLVSMPRLFGFQVSELWLYDPEHILGGLIVGGERYGRQLQLNEDVYSLQELYDLDPGVVLIDATDSRMFEVLKTEQGIDRAVLMPLMDEGRLIGSLHCGFSDDALTLDSEEHTILAHLTSIISLCLKNAISRQQISQLSLLDPLTQCSNSRGFELDIAREISRARRLKKPMTMLKMEIDEFDDLYNHYGEITGQFVMKKVMQRVFSALRATDYMARFSGSRMAVLIPGCGEVVGREIAERMRMDIENFAIDDGRGAIMHVTLSSGLVTWEPSQYPAVDMGQLARQMQSVATKALETSQSNNGNRITISRLSTLIV